MFFKTHELNLNPYPNLESKPDTNNRSVTRLNDTYFKSAQLRRAEYKKGFVLAWTRQKIQPPKGFSKRISLTLIPTLILSLSLTLTIGLSQDWMIHILKVHNSGVQNIKRVLYWRQLVKIYRLQSFFDELNLNPYPNLWSKPDTNHRSVTRLNDTYFKSAQLRRAEYEKGFVLAWTRQKIQPPKGFSKRMSLTLILTIIMSLSLTLTIGLSQDWMIHILKVHNSGAQNMKRVLYWREQGKRYSLQSF